MFNQNHASRVHALLGASGADRWINCPPSARLTENMADKASEYAEYGTLGHELSEIYLRRQLTPCDSKLRKKLDDDAAKLKQNPLYDNEMGDAISSYVNIVAEEFLGAKARTMDAVLMLEERLDFSEWVPDGYGTGDVVIIADGALTVIDLKMGKGVPVSAFNNPQIRLYALGAWHAYGFLYDIQEIHMTIVQPRLDSVSTDIMSIDELLAWADETVKPAAALAYAGRGEYLSGSHCKWCKVKATCRARADANMAAIAHEFQDPALMTLEEIGNILHIAEQLKAWAKDVEDYAFEQAKAGHTVQGWKLVEGRSNRVFTDKEAVKNKLLQSGFSVDKIFKPQELVTMGELENRVVGKKRFGELLSDLITKPPGKPVLVPETDKRVELNSVEADFAGEDFDG